MDFIYKENNGLYAVWLPDVNRYIILLEPAFRVFHLWSGKSNEQDIIKEVAELYKLPSNEAEQFVNEITEQLRGLLEGVDKKENPSFPANDPGKTENHSVVRVYSIGGANVSINYSNSYIEENIRPRILHLETDCTEKIYHHIFTLTFSDGLYFLEAGNTEKRSFKLVEELAGGLYLQILNIIHGIPPDSWMGVAHASAVTDGNKAILFMAPSGGGKSTISALMLANGFKLLSDDFVPIALTEPEIYTFPAGISVKKTAIPYLKDFFPEIEDLTITERPGNNKNGVFLPFPAESLITKNVKTAAIVFIQYDQSVQCRFKKQPNHELMNQFVSESWIANNPVAAGRFLDWYFNLPVYSLHYSDSKKAIAVIKKIFKD